MYFLFLYKQWGGTMITDERRYRAGTFEVIGFDLHPIMESHPEYSDILTKLGARANPPFLYGVLTTEQRDNIHPNTAGLKEPGESNFAADQRYMGQMKSALLDSARGLGADATLLKILHEVTPAYYDCEFVAADVPARKQLKAIQPQHG